MKALSYIILASLAAILSSCSSTPASRIQKNPGLYASLSPKHQRMVRQGRIDRGMTKPAVYLAMGHPDTKFSGQRDGKTQDRWDYDVYVPVYSHGFSPYYGYGRGYYGHHGFTGIYFHPTVHYVPRRGTSIYFKSHKVSGWSRIQRNF